MSAPTPDPIAERKTRERLAFLALPPQEAQRMITLGTPASGFTVIEVDQDLSYGLEEEPPFHEMVDE